MGISEQGDTLVVDGVFGGEDLVGAGVGDLFDVGDGGVVCDLIIRQVNVAGDVAGQHVNVLGEIALVFLYVGFERS